jgi:hypothetical protein
MDTVFYVVAQDSHPVPTDQIFMMVWDDKTLHINRMGPSYQFSGTDVFHWFAIGTQS